MNKTFRKNILLALVLTTFSLFSCDRRNDEDRFQAEIRYFILEHLDNDIAYNPVRFQRIDNDFLSSDMTLMTSVLAIQDTVRTKVNMALNFSVEFESPVIQAFLSMENNFEIDLIDELILENVKLDNALKAKLKSSQSTFPENYRAQQQLFNDQLFDINNALSHFNLSAYHIDLSGKTSTFYLHEYQLNQAQSITTVFELNTESLEVLSFKDI
ncbi:hypothetical protein OB69_08755 [Roseivirga seohaensis subsp. aquiponti]|uniref:Lipoprotein n=1 Tax=Roseivirga seohaensis subsp. aquiponti TaxID=1566026 RepID=A0A0L8AKF0_9BACT|nr:hypothetical protein [Roseivirga seohaensis]KOF02923.1 hypothetical protein OB69_08755 [Roseivirga seohaensis subsp. aquiponti]